MKKLAMLLLIGLAACEVGGTAPNNPNDPGNLSFQLTPSGDPNVPLAILLAWDPPSNGLALTFDVYGRSSGTGWIRRATTTSPTFHDAGVPQSQYYIVALDEQGVELGRTETITIDLAVRPPAPLGLVSTTLNAAVHLRWSDNAVHSTAAQFDHYRVYSTAYSAARGNCDASWFFEGSTVSDGFLVGNLTNGETRCYAVSAISVDGHESSWSNLRLDTPRRDAMSAIVYVGETKADSAAFVFNDESGKIFGVVGPAARADADFSLARHADGTVWISAARVGATMRTYQSATIPELTTIDRAPATGYASTPVEALPGAGYVFQLQEADGMHYAAMRIQYVTKDFIIFDWAYQEGINNVELYRGRRW